MNINSTKGVADLVIEEERVSALEALRGDAPDSLLLVCSCAFLAQNKVIAVLTFHNTCFNLPLPALPLKHTDTNNEILAHIPEGEHGEVGTVALVCSFVRPRKLLVENEHGGACFS